jgi:hypothetical protein
LKASFYFFDMPKYSVPSLFTPPLIGGVILAGLLAACGNLASDPDDRPYAVATTGMIAEIATRIGGDEIRVESLMPTGVDPHLFKPSHSDVQRLGQADVIFYNGLHLEGKMTEILARMARYRTIVAVAEQVPPAERLSVGEFDGQFDPHLWFDVRLWTRIIDPIQEVFSELLPEDAETFRNRAMTLRNELLDLDQWAETALSVIPPERRILVTAHDAFGYLGGGTDSRCSVCRASAQPPRPVYKTSNDWFNASLRTGSRRSSLKPAFLPVPSRPFKPPAKPAAIQWPSAVSCSPTRWARPARRKEPIPEWSATISAPCSKRFSDLIDQETCGNAHPRAVAQLHRYPIPCPPLPFPTPKSGPHPKRLLPLRFTI